MYLVSFTVAFGTLILLKASLAQSLPYVYQDSAEDEEALIDRIASIARAVGSQQQQQQQLLLRKGYNSYPTYNLQRDSVSDDGGYYGESDGEGIWDDLQLQNQLREELEKPRQFAYKPDDPRFFIPADQFPNRGDEYESVKAEVQNPKHPQTQPPSQPHGNHNQQDDFNAIDPFPNGLPSSLQEETPLDNGPGLSHKEHLHDEGNRDDFNNPFMKKDASSRALRQPEKRVQDLNSGPLLTDQGLSHSGFLRQPEDSFSYSDIYYIGLIAGCSAAVVIGLVAAGIFWIHQRVKAAAEVDYPAYGVTGPNKEVSPSGGDRKLAQSAQMYHYQHQKQQMAALQKGVMQTAADRQGSAGSDIESEEDNEDDNDYTVYECPGLAPAGEMEVKNPLFQDEATPATPHLKSEDDK